MGSRRATSSDGFTIIEVLVALFVLLVGLVGTFALVNAANARSTGTKGREGATNLAREVAEQVRLVNYGDVTSAALDAKLQAQPGLADATPATPTSWQISRRGFEYTIATSICTVDDRGDKFGDHSAGGFCADSSTSGPPSDDPTPEDLKRVTVAVSFFDRGRQTTVRLTDTLNSTGQSSGLAVSDLELTSTTAATSIPTPKEPVITSSAVTSLTFTATATSLAGCTSANPARCRINWTIEGRRGTPEAVKVNATTWRFTWAVSGVSDGTYKIGAQTVDARGEVGPSREIPVRLARLAAPPAPTALYGGYNVVNRLGTATDVAELRWPARPERIVEGYRVYRGDGTLACPGNSTVISSATSCIDFTPPASTGTAAARTYKVVALYRDQSNALMETNPGRTLTIVPISTTTTTSTPNPSTSAFVDYAYKLQNTTTNIGTNCTGATTRDLREGTPVATGTRSGANAQIAFCSPAFTLGANETKEIPAGTATVKLDMRPNTINGNSTCTITATLKRQGTTTAVLATQTYTFTKTATNQYYVWNPSYATTTLAAGDKLVLNLQWGATTECGQMFFYYGGSGTAPGEVSLRTRTTTSPPPTVTTTTTTTRPNAPTGLTATPQVDGTTKLAWTPPASGPAVDFYRIYMDGTDYTNRIDTAGDGTSGPQFEFVPGGSHTFRVTAVAPTLTESVFTTAAVVP